MFYRLKTLGSFQYRTFRYARDGEATSLVMTLASLECNEIIFYRWQK